MKNRYLILGLLMLAASTGVYAQDADTAVTPPTTEEQLTTLKGRVDGIDESYLATAATVDKLSKIKVSGYIQAQYQVTDVKGVLDSKNSLLRQRFAIKRGRLKTTYDAGLAKYALELDVTQDGVAMKDAFVAISEPWLKSFTFTAGSMDRPFGYEVGYSSSMLESPERSKVIGFLFPKEKDLGAMIEFAQEDGPLSFLNAKVGVYNGQTNILNENDDTKDIIGRIGFKSAFKDIGLAIDGGVSGYFGKVTNVDSSKTISKIDSVTNPAKKDTSYVYGNNYVMNGTAWQKTTGQLKSLTDRQYIGADMQVYYSLPVIGGICLKGEYIAGKHPTQGGSDDYYSNSSITSTSLNYYPLASGVYERNFAGGYVYLVQNIDPIGCQFVLKYDYFDPNTKVTGSDFVNTSAVAAVGTTPAIPAVKTTLTSADIAYTTWGVGLIYYVKWDPNVRLQLYYEMPKNEKLDAAKVTTGSLVAYTKAVNKNMLTFRVQYKF